MKTGIYVIAIARSILSRSAIVALVLLAGLSHINAHASEREAILAVMDAVFAAVSTGEPDDWRALLLPQGTTISLHPHPDGSPDQTGMRVFTNEVFMAGLRPSGRELLERWTEDPTVLIRGPMAVVWGAFDFWIDGEFSHCGVNAVDLVKVDGDWKVANLMWTTEREGCPTASGP